MKKLLIFAIALGLATVNQQSKAEGITADDAKLMKKIFAVAAGSLSKVADMPEEKLQGSNPTTVVCTVLSALWEKSQVGTSGTGKPIMKNIWEVLATIASIPDDGKKALRAVGSLQGQIDLFCEESSAVR